MYFYAVTIICFILIFISFCVMITEKWRIYLPRTWKRTFYSKTILASFLNKKLANHRVFEESKIDLFREIPFWLFITLFIVSLVISIIDASNLFFISHFLGDLSIMIISIGLFCLYDIYIIFIVALWSFLNRNDYKKIGEADKEIIGIVFSENKSKKTIKKEKKRL